MNTSPDTSKRGRAGAGRSIKRSLHDPIASRSGSGEVWHSPAKAPKSPKPAQRPAIDRDIFGLFLFAKRFVRRQTPAAVARAAGVTALAVTRAEQRRPIGPRQFARLCDWQGEQPEIFFRIKRRGRAKPGPGSKEGGW